MSQDEDLPELTTRIDDGAEPAVLHVAGEVDLFTAPDFEAALTAATTTHARVVVDLREVRFMDSTGLRALLEARRRLAEGGGGLELEVAGSGAVPRLLELAGVAGLFGLRPDDSPAA